MKQKQNNQFSEKTLSKKDDKFFLDLARDFYAKHGRVPATKELGYSNRRIIYRRFKTWENFIQTALGRAHNFKHWSDQDILQWLATLYKELNRFPTHTEIVNRNQSVAKLIYLRFDNLHAAFEKAIGTSVRREIFKALEQLTPPGCDNASTQEIFIEMQKNGIKTSKQVVANTLDYLKREWYIKGGRSNGIGLWSLTPKGKYFLKHPNEGAGDGRRRDRGNPL